jgi:peptide deformylase
VILPIVKYGHPTLRQRGARVERVTPEIMALVSDMLETMHAASGIGLAAQQVDRALQVMVIDVREVKDRPSTLELNGRQADVHSFMPLALINPEIKPAGPPVAGAEGCLSFPEIFSDITRPEQIEVAGLDGRGEPIRFRCGGLLARAIQHENDHLQGILFVDRMPIEEKDKLKPELDQLMAETRAGLRKKAA